MIRECQVDIYDQFHEPYAKKKMGDHDWRLWEREWEDEGWLETWYCTRCRLVDERRVEAKGVM